MKHFMNTFYKAYLEPLTFRKTLESLGFWGWFFGVGPTLYYFNFIDFEFNGNSDMFNAVIVFGFLNLGGFTTYALIASAITEMIERWKVVKEGLVDKSST